MSWLYKKGSAESAKMFKRQEERGTDSSMSWLYKTGSMESAKTFNRQQGVESVTKESLTGAATAVTDLFETMNTCLSTERDSLDSLNLSSMRKCIHTGGLLMGLGLKLQDVDIVFSSIGVKQVSLYGVAYVLVRLIARCSKVHIKSGSDLLDALSEALSAFITNTRNCKGSEGKKLSPAFDLSEMTTADLSSLKRLLEAQTSALVAIFSAYKPSAPQQHFRRGSRAEDGEVISVDAAIRFSLDFSIVPGIISRSQFLDVLKRSMVYYNDEEVGSGSEVTIDHFKRLIVNLSLSVPTFRTGIDSSRMTATVLVSNFLLWMRRKASSWHRQVSKRASSRGAISVPVLAFNLDQVRSTVTTLDLHMDDEHERMKLLSTLCGVDRSPQSRAPPHTFK
jgi:hypothetical protein